MSSSACKDLLAADDFHALKQRRAHLLTGDCDAQNPEDTFPPDIPSARPAPRKGGSSYPL